MTPPKDDLKNRKFGRLKPIKRITVANKRNSYWVCLCDCGNEVTVSRPRIVNGSTKSCGCLRKENSAKIHTTHGLKNKNQDIYSRWSSMKRRCKDNKTKNRQSYLLRGIGYCDEWEHFINFYNDMKESFEKHVSIFGKKHTTLERVDVNVGYSKENCIWTTWDKQAENKRNNFWFVAVNKITGAKILSRNQKKTARDIGVGQGSVSHALKIGYFRVLVKKTWVFSKVHVFNYR